MPEWMPGAGFKRIARQYATTLSQMTNQPYEFVKRQMRDKRHKPSFLSQCIEADGDDAQLESIHKFAAMSLALGGADTVSQRLQPPELLAKDVQTVSALMTFFLAMLMFPEVQKRAQEEIDNVIGGGRLPTSADRDALPYIEAIMKETHRWHQVLPMCIPHTSTEEDVCRGYRIPKGSTLLPNNW